MTKDGLQKPNYFGSLTHAATLRVGNYKGEEIHVPFSSLLPMVHPNDFVLGGWDISGACTVWAGRAAIASGSDRWQCLRGQPSMDVCPA
jgi:hypothetical protein